MSGQNDHPTPHSLSANSGNPRHVTIAIVTLIAAWLILCRPWFFGNRVVPCDSKDQFYPALSCCPKDPLRSSGTPHSGAQETTEEHRAATFAENTKAILEIVSKQPSRN